MAEDGSWQVFKVSEPDPQDDPIDGRPAIGLFYVGRITRPDDARIYWKLDEIDVGQRFGEGRYIAFADAMVEQWDEPRSSFAHDVCIMLDVEAETHYRRRKRTDDEGDDDV